MKELTKYAFLVKHYSYSPTTQLTELKSDKFNTKIVGVSNVNEAINAINELIDNDIELVELCGGFDDKEKIAIMNGIKKSIPIGKADLDDKNVELLNTILQ